MSTQAPPKWTGRLLPLLVQYGGDIPMDLLLGWIATESGGRLDEVTSLEERGYFQVHPDEASQLGIPDFEALSTDPEESVKWGIALVRQYMARAQQLGFTPGTDLFYRITKFLHAMGSGGVQKFLQDMASNGVAPGSWDEIKQYADDNQPRLFSLLKHDPVKWIGNVDSVFTRGSVLAALAGVANPFVVAPVGALALGAMAWWLWPKIKKRWGKP